MTTAVSTIKADYLERVASGLRDLSDDDREEVLQDLRAHLAELEEEELETALGSPDEFVAEFRASAGLDDQMTRRRKWSLTKARVRLEEGSLRLAAVSRWQAWRSLWIWTRGWFLLSTIAVFSGGIAFRRFPVPQVAESTIIGLSLLALVTWASVWLDRRGTGIRYASSFLLSSLVVILLLGTLLSERDVGQVYHFQEEAFYPDQLIAPDGESIANIYAYDLDGNPVEVLLFDQTGRPLRSLPTWVYEEAEQNPGFQDPFEYGEGAVTFVRDEFGRIIPNLYPLDLYQHTGYGLEPVPPPSLGFPQPDTATSDQADGVVTTTMNPGSLD